MWAALGTQLESGIVLYQTSSPFFCSGTSYHCAHCLIQWTSTTPCCRPANFRPKRKTPVGSLHCNSSVSLIPALGQLTASMKIFTGPDMFWKQKHLRARQLHSYYLTEVDAGQYVLVWNFLTYYRLYSPMGYPMHGLENVVELLYMVKIAKSREPYDGRKTEVTGFIQLQNLWLPIITGLKVL